MLGLPLRMAGDAACKHPPPLRAVLCGSAGKAGGAAAAHTFCRLAGSASPGGGAKSDGLGLFNCLLGGLGSHPGGCAVGGKGGAGRAAARVATACARVGQGREKGL